MIHSGEHSVRVVCSELIHLENYTQPNAPGMARYCGEREKNEQAVNTESVHKRWMSKRVGKKGKFSIMVLRSVQSAGRILS